VINVIKIKKLALKKKKEKSVSDEGDRGFTNPFGYSVTDPYIQVGKNSYLSIFDVLISYGTNRPAGIGWLINVLPKDPLKSGKVLFAERQRLMDKNTADKIVDKDLTVAANVVANEKTDSARQETKNRIRYRDAEISAQLAGVDEKIIDSDLRLIVKAKTPKLVEKTIRELEASYKNNGIKGVMLVRETGRQMKELEGLLPEVSADAWHNADMESVAAGRLFLPSSGFSDEHGVYVGTDRRSLLADNPAIIEFSNVRNAVIFMGDVAPYVNFSELGLQASLINGGSAVAHLISESNWLKGNRTHHIMLQDFSYHSPDSLIFNMQKEAINPFETFGTMETVQQDANANFDKIVNIMMLLTKQQDNKAYLISQLKTLLINWFVHTAGGNGMYDEDPNAHPTRASRILATSDHKHYPTPRNFIPELKSNVAKRRNEDALSGKEATFLHDTLNTEFTRYSNIFDKPTTLPDVFKSDQRNIYYDLSKLGQDSVVNGAVFLNVIAYVVHRALPGEMIVIHGLDNVDVPLAPLLAYKEVIARKNIGLVTVYEHSERKINPKTFQKFSGRLSEQDMVVLGGISQEESKYLSESWHHELPQPVNDQLLEAASHILYFHRNIDQVGALIDTYLNL
jgi:hypothetical protein